jgi:integrase/recombinase XerD
VGSSSTALVLVSSELDLAPRSTPTENPAIVYLARLAPGSRRTMAGCVRRIAAMLGADVATCAWGALRYQHTQAIRARLAERYSFRTANLHVAALRGVLKEAWRLGQMSAEAYHAAADLEPVRGHRELAGRHVARLELRDLFAACGDGPAGARDRALLAILAGAGLRRSEAVALCVSDYDVNSGALRVLGKGNKTRTAYVTNAAKSAVDCWLVLRGQVPGALLCPVRRGGRIEIRHMTDAALRLRCVELARRAGVRGFSPHDLRRTWISDLLDLGADLVAVQGLAGHSSPAITSRYDRRGERAKIRAAELLVLPVSRE